MLNERKRRVAIPAGVNAVTLLTRIRR